MAIEELIAVVSAPDRPVHADDPGRWAALAAEFGPALPADWLSLGRRYGSGALDRGNTWVCNPLAPDTPAEVRDHLALFRHNQAHGCPYPFDLHPSVPGFLPWGSDENGNSYGWLTGGEPDRWPVAFVGHGRRTDWCGSTCR